MGIFSRRKNADVRDSDASQVDVSDVSADETDVVASDAVNDEPESQAQIAARAQRAKLRPRDDIDLTHGPFDAADVDAGERLNFGALLIEPMQDVEMRLDVDESTQTITGLTVMLGSDNSGAVQLQAFAAPKTSGIWYGIRREIADAIVTAGGEADEMDGALGTELHVRMPSQGPDGRVTFAPARFIGVDGPRWFLRAVLSGQAAIDEHMTARAMDVVRSVAVHRGSEARAPRELLELSIPAELPEQDAEPAPEPDNRDARIERMERGPEITEIQ